MVAVKSRTAGPRLRISQAYRLRNRESKSSCKSAVICGGLYHATQQIATKSVGEKEGVKGEEGKREWGNWGRA